MGRVEAALTRAVRSREIPDYHAFQAFMSDRVAVERDASGNPMTGAAMPSAMAAVLLLVRYRDRLKAGSISPVNFRRYKLLLSLFAGNDRARDFANALTAADVPDDLTVDDDGMTAAGHRRRLILAMGQGRFGEALFLLGRLSEADHDPGERAFFGAMIASAEGNWDRVIANVDRVPVDAIDRPRAAWLALKARAARGDIGGARPLLDEIGGGLSPCAWLHLIELLAAAGVREGIEPIYEHLPSPLVVGSSDPAYAEWAMLHVRLVGRFLARDLEMEVAAEATGSAISDPTWVEDAASRPGAVAVAIESGLGGGLTPRAVCGRLDPLMADHDLQAFRTAVEIMFEAGDHVGVVTLANRFRSGAAMPWSRDLGLVAILHASATVVGDGSARRLGRLLTPERLERTSHSARRLSTAKELTTMARLSFLAADAELDRVAAEDDRWRDCGLIALGLFRAIEVELNARLVRPLAERLDLGRLVTELPTDAKPLRNVLKSVSAAGRDGGLMLGQIRDLVTALAPDAADAPTSASVRREMMDVFADLLLRSTDAVGARAALLGMMGNAAVRSFRNAPAHGEFVRLADALAARDHADAALAKLLALLPGPRAEAGPGRERRTGGRHRRMG